MAIINGTNNDDSLIDTLEDDSLFGFDGNDTLRTDHGNDTLLGGAGDDRYILWSHGTSTIVEQANEGVDTVLSSVTWTLGANLEKLTLFGTGAINGTGNNLNNTFVGNGAANVFTGGAGDDTYGVGAGDTVVEAANEGVDHILSAVSWTLGANIEKLTLTGTDTINGIGNSLNNTFVGNSAANVLTGGAGDDIYGVGAGDTVVEAANEGVDLVLSNVSVTLGANIEKLTLTGSAANGTGNELNNTLVGNSGANILTGGAGDDTYGVNTGDTVVEAANEGVDHVLSTVSWILGANIEKLTLTGTAAIDGTGNSLSNTFVGNSEANVLTGGPGDDTYGVGVGDMVVEAANEGNDLVYSDISWTLGNHIEKLTLTGTAAIDGTGNDWNNILRGNSAANVLTGLRGDDVLDGGAGADILIGGMGYDTYYAGVGDTLVENIDEGIDTVYSTISWTLGAHLDWLTLTGTEAINGTGNELENRLIGNSAANVLTGGAGNDNLVGGDGDDWLYGGTGDDGLNGGAGADVLIGGTFNDFYIVSTGDTVVEGTTAGVDLVWSDVTWTLDANIENLTLRGMGAIDATGNSQNNILEGNSAANVLTGGAGNDTLTGGLGNDTYRIDRGEGQDKITPLWYDDANRDRLLYGATINPIDLVLSRQVFDLRIAIHGSTDMVTIQHWYLAPTIEPMEPIQAGNGQTLHGTQVDQLIQAMASFSQQTGLTWDQAIDQQPQQVQAILAASWQ